MTGATMVQPQSSGKESDSRLYLYAVLEGSARPTVTDEVSASVGGLEFVAAAGLVAAASRVPAELEDAVRRLDEAARSSSEATAPAGDAAAALEAAIRSHELVVERLFESHALLPLRLGTVVRGAADVRQLLERHAADLHAQLDLVRGRREWGVKVSWLSSIAQARSAARDGGGRGGTEGGPGHAYLAARRRQRLEASNLAETCRTRARAIEESLTDVARATCAVGFLGAADTGSEHEDAVSVRILDGAFLVAQSEESRFFASLDAALGADEGLSADVSGPWPPYSFVRGVKGDAS